MLLNALLHFSDIVIQTHDIPDADAIASGFAVWHYLTENGITPQLIYSGSQKITKPNLVNMIDRLHIPIEYAPELDRAPELLLTVDCCYDLTGNAKRSNVTRLPFRTYAAIDHHNSTLQGELFEIRSSYGSCAAIIAKMREAEGTDLHSPAMTDVMTALYYGMYMDTVALSEIRHPADKDLRDNPNIDHSMIRFLVNSNFTRDELGIISEGLRQYEALPAYRCAVTAVQPCDPNLLGIITDTILQVDSVDTCIAYSPMHDCWKLSVRSCINEINAADLAQYLTLHVGNGGGHSGKAGGVVLMNSLGDAEIGAFLHQRLADYHTKIVSLYPGKDRLDTAAMQCFRKKDIVIGYVPSLEVCGNGKNIHIRMLEGDTDITAGENTYLLVGVSGEVYPIQRGKFEKKYSLSDKAPEILGDRDAYQPTVTVEGQDSSRALFPMLRGCIATGQDAVLACRLEQFTKVFPAWMREGYLYGQPGDYLVCTLNDPNDYYIVKEKIFQLSYAPAET